MSFEKFSALFDDKTVEELSDDEFEKRVRVYELIQKLNKPFEQFWATHQDKGKELLTSFKNFLREQIEHQKKFMPGILTAQAAFAFLNLNGILTPEHFSGVSRPNFSDSTEAMYTLFVIISGAASTILAKSLDKYLSSLADKINKLTPNFDIKNEPTNP